MKEKLNVALIVTLQGCLGINTAAQGFDGYRNTGLFLILCCQLLQSRINLNLVVDKADAAFCRSCFTGCLCLTG